MNPPRIRLRFTILAHVYFSSVRYPKNRKKSSRLRVDVTTFSLKVSRANLLPRGIYRLADIEATGENHRVTANLLTDMEQDHQKSENRDTR